MKKTDSMWAKTNHLLTHQMFGNAFQDYLLHHLSINCGDANQTVVPWILLLMSSLLTHTGLLWPLLGFLHIRTDDAWAWRRRSLKYLPPLFSPGPHFKELFQARPWTCQSLLSWCPGLRSCHLSCSLLAGSWIPLYHGNCSQGCPSLHSPGQFFLVCKYEVQESTSSHHLIDHLC